MHAIQKAYGHVCDSWQQRKLQLDQGIQLRMFEADCQKVMVKRLRIIFDFSSSHRDIFILQMFDWMFQSREDFLTSYFDIGNSHVSSKELQEDHKCFSLSSMVKSTKVIFKISKSRERWRIKVFFLSSKLPFSVSYLKYVLLEWNFYSTV